ncbi:MAG: hypothetical protein AAF481_04855 [Acidobacteriota bacterium]
MVTLGSLWLPILVSAVVVHLASFIVWMVLPHHRSDWAKLPDEDAFADAVNKQAPAAPGQYAIPHAANPSDWKSEEVLERMRRGPVGFLILKPAGQAGMGKNLALHFVHCLVIGTLAAYIGAQTLPAGASYLKVFQVVGTAAILGWAGCIPVNANWYGHSWSSTLKSICDGVAYGLLTAGVFGWLWP